MNDSQASCMVELLTFARMVARETKGIQSISANGCDVLHKMALAAIQRYDRMTVEPSESGKRIAELEGQIEQAHAKIRELMQGAR